MDRASWLARRLGAFVRAIGSSKDAELVKMSSPEQTRKILRSIDPDDIDSLPEVFLALEAVRQEQEARPRARIAALGDLRDEKRSVTAPDRRKAFRIIDGGARR